MDSASDTIIQVRNLTAGYGEVIVIDDISFDVERGEVFVILGGSGCGKSTLLKHMIGLLSPVAGEVLIDGEDIIAAGGADRERLLRKFGVTFQAGALFGSMTLLENVCLPLEEFTELPEEACKLVALMKLDLVGLREYADRIPSELSGGMQKRAAIARAIALDPQILFMDEPSAGLDPITSAGLDELILSLAKSLDVTFVIVTHELPSIRAVADRVIMLRQETKKIAAEGSPAELSENRDDPWVWNFFNRQVGATDQ